jgi:hypothetical protein
MAGLHCRSRSRCQAQRRPSSRCQSRICQIAEAGERLSHRSSLEITFRFWQCTASRSYRVCTSATEGRVRFGRRTSLSPLLSLYTPRPPGHPNCKSPPASLANYDRNSSPRFKGENDMRNRVIHLAACLTLGAATTAFFVGCDRGADNTSNGRSGAGSSSGTGTGGTASSGSGASSGAGAQTSGARSSPDSSSGTGAGSSGTGTSSGSGSGSSTSGSGASGSGSSSGGGTSGGSTSGGGTSGGSTSGGGTSSGTGR